MHRSGDEAAGDEELEKTVIPIVEEEARITKRLVTTGRVRVTTTADVVEEVAEASLSGEDIEIVRIPVDRVVTEPPATRTEGDVTIIPVVEEIIVVERRLVVKEEIHLRRRATTEAVSMPITLRKQRVVVERVNETGQPINEDRDNDL